jgi:general secretion pathway protein G
MPLAKVSIQRQRETELRRSLREMRTAIDKFKDAADAGAIAPTEMQAGSENYPPSLETLVNGVTKNNDATGVKLKFLRRIVRPDDALHRMGDARIRTGPSPRRGGQQCV